MTARDNKETKMDMQAAMDTYEKLAIPGAPHRMLAAMSGRWNASIRSWMEPGGPVTESSGTSEQKMILGGRFLQQDFTSEVMGSPFDGMGITGYDNHTRKYVSTWMDSMSTAIMYFEGTAGPDGKTIIQEASYDDPVKGPMKWRSLTSIPNDDTVLFEMYVIDGKGKEEKMMEITYTRQDQV